MDTLEAKDKVLKAIEDILREIIRKEDLQKASITLWRWEQPDIELRWLHRFNSVTHLWKNIHSLVTNESVPYLVVIDINAWEDVDKGESRERKLRSESSIAYEVTSLDHAKVMDASKRPLWDSYYKVKIWASGNLEKPVEIGTKK